MVSIWIRVQRYDEQKFLNGNKIHIFKKKCNIIIPPYRPPGRNIKLYRRSLQPSKENIQHLKNNRFLHFFSDPDPCVLKADPAD
jgi:hypothetical protein